uniref:Uncharacterized protein n=1 Tax=Noccaea caerulescens TaxID=107243 RepID=A0A1J3F4M9_NOCCA
MVSPTCRLNHGFYTSECNFNLGEHERKVGVSKARAGCLEGQQRLQSERRFPSLPPTTQLRHVGRGGSVERRRDGEPKRRREGNLRTLGIARKELKPEATAGSRQRKSGSRNWGSIGEEDMTEATRRTEGKTRSEGRSGGSGERSRE